MASKWRKVTEYLGLAPDEDDAGYQIDDDFEDAPERARPVARAPRPAAVQPEADVIGTVRPLPGQSRPSSNVEFEDTGVVVRPVSAATASPSPVVVRPADPVVSAPQVVVPTSFGEAQEVADRFKSRRPVIMNLQEVDRELSRRLIDFASGLCYGLGGRMDKVANQVFLLVPADVTVSEAEQRRLAERGFQA